MSANDLIPRIAVGSSPNLRGKALEQLALQVGGYLNVLSLSDGEIRSWLCRFKRPFEGRGSLYKNAEVIKRRCDEKGIKILFVADGNYPVRLREIYKPPLLLYYRGELPEVFGSLERKVVSIIGTRSVTKDVEQLTFDWSDHLSSQGVYVVSGMALGVDAFAHWGALKSGPTTAVLGGGADVVYPYGNSPLYKTILATAQSVLVSEHPPGTRPLRYHFPLRNRIISGLSDVVLLMQSTTSGGGMITMKCALEDNKEILVYGEGSPVEFFSGNRKLIEEGARPVRDLSELSECFGLCVGEEERAPVEMSLLECRIMEVLSPNEMTSLSDLARSLLLGTDAIAGALLRLVLRGFVGEAPGKRYYRKRSVPPKTLAVGSR